MQKQPGRRVRRRKLLRLSPAERMRRLRERRRMQGLKAVVSWVPRKRAVQLPPLYLRLLEARSLAVHVAAAIKIDRDPALLDLARQTVARWRERDSGAAGDWKRCWGAILDLPWPAIATVMTEQSERGVQLRQATPFMAVLTPYERRRIYDAFRVVKARLDAVAGS